MARDRLMGAAWRRALELVEAGAPPAGKRSVPRPGPAGAAPIRAALAGRDDVTDTDHVMAEALIGVLCGDAAGEASADEVMEAELDALLRLGRTAASRARMAHMLKTGKPLRN